MIQNIDSEITELAHRASTMLINNYTIKVTGHRAKKQKNITEEETRTMDWKTRKQG